MTRTRIILIGAILCLAALVVIGSVRAANIVKRAIIPPPTVAAASAEEKTLLLPSDLTIDGQTVLVLYGLTSSNSGKVYVIRDPAALIAAQGVATVVTSETLGQAFGSFTLALMGASPQERFAEVYQGETLVHSITCLSTACGKFGEAKVDYAGLDTAGQFFQPTDASFDSYAAYETAIADVRANPEQAFLRYAVRADFPEQEQPKRLRLQLPSIALRAGTELDTLNIVQREEIARLAAQLPDGVTIRSLTPTRLTAAQITPIGDAARLATQTDPALFTEWTFYALSLSLDGISSLDDLDGVAWAGPHHGPAALDDDFAAALAARYGVTCTTCYGLRVTDYIDQPYESFSTGGRYWLFYYEAVSP